jgi:hypothetical protein
MESGDNRIPVDQAMDDCVTWELILCKGAEIASLKVANRVALLASRNGQRGCIATAMAAVAEFASAVAGGTWR